MRTLFPRRKSRGGVRILQVHARRLIGVVRYPNAALYRSEFQNRSAVLSTMYGFFTKFYNREKKRFPPPVYVKNHDFSAITLYAAN